MPICQRTRSKNRYRRSLQETEEKNDTSEEEEEEEESSNEIHQTRRKRRRRSSLKEMKDKNDTSEEEEEESSNETHQNRVKRICRNKPKDRIHKVDTSLTRNQKKKQEIETTDTTTTANHLKKPDVPFSRDINHCTNPSNVARHQEYCESLSSCCDESSRTLDDDDDDDDDDDEAYDERNSKFSAQDFFESDFDSSENANDEDESTVASSNASSQFCRGEENRFHLSQKEQQWNEMYERLIDFQSIHGHCHVPTAFFDQALAIWVKRQRNQYKLFLDGTTTGSCLIDKRVRALCEIGFVWDRHGDVWSKHYNELKHYKEKFGHTNVPCNYSGNSSLGNWVKAQRRQYALWKKGETSFLTTDRIFQLEHIGFQWEPPRRGDSEGWNGYCDDLKQFKEKFGHTDVPFKYRGNTSLGVWVKRQRRAYTLLKQGKHSLLTPHRLCQLESIGFQWQSRKRMKGP